jgi:hypothetical protein
LADPFINPTSGILLEVESRIIQRLVVAVETYYLIDMFFSSPIRNCNKSSSVTCNYGTLDYNPKEQTKGKRDEDPLLVNKFPCNSVDFILNFQYGLAEG